MQAEKKIWNQQQKALREALNNPSEFSLAIQLFLKQHAMGHRAEMSGAGLWSFEDQVWQGLSEAQARRIPPGGEHSIAWVIWHITRIEDITMNILVTGGAQMMLGERWEDRMNVYNRDTGNGMSVEEIVQLSSTIDLDVLQEYRLQVGRQTQALVQRLSPMELHQKVTQARLQRIINQEAVRPEAQDLLAYWGRMDIAGLLVMPPTRHTFVHLNEALRLKK